MHWRYPFCQELPALYDERENLLGGLYRRGSQLRWCASDTSDTQPLPVSTVAEAKKYVVVALRMGLFEEKT